MKFGPFSLNCKLVKNWQAPKWKRCIQPKYHKGVSNSHCWGWKCLKSSKEDFEHFNQGQWEFGTHAWVFHQDTWAMDEGFLGRIRWAYSRFLSLLWIISQQNCGARHIYNWNQMPDFNSIQDQRFKALPLVKIKKTKDGVNESISKYHY